VPLWAATKPTFPQLNLHSTRIRRNPNGFLQVVVSNARQSIVLSTTAALLAAIPGPNPISRMRSDARMSSNDSTQSLRSILEGRLAMT
jgi:hypothetical protein